MATNTKRTSRTVREHSETFSNVSGDSHDSAFSPLNLSRKQEKEALSGLNDRLATYIEKVRSLEAENSRLHVQIREVEVVERKEKENLASRYENKIEDLRKALDRANSDRNKVEYEASSSIARFNEMKSRADKFEKELKRVEKERNYTQSLVSDLQAKNDDNENRRRYAEEKLAELEKELADLQKRFDTVQGQLQDEVIFRGELQTKYDRLKEDLDFERRTHANQLEEVRRKRQVEMTTLQAEKETEYNAKLRDHLESMRADFDTRLASASSQLSDMNERLRQRDEQITALNMEIRERIKSYQDLLQTKIQLDTELQAYHKLLEGEEARLHITPTSTPNTSINTSAVNTSSQHISFSDVFSSTRRGVKRRRLEVDDQINFDRSSKTYKSTSNAESDLEFEEVDPEGKFVRLINKGEEKTSIGGWTITVTDNDREVSFKFHSRQALEGGHTTTIWSSDSTETHKAPETIVMKNQKWLTGDFIRAELHNESGQVVAWRENHYSEGFNITSRDDPNERCFIM